MVAMLETAIARHPELKVHYIHGTQNGRAHAMRDHVRDFASGRTNVQVTTFYEAPEKADLVGKDYDQEGLIDKSWLADATPIGEADYYLCGPRPFLRRYVSALLRAGVSVDRIHYEFFGPADEVVAA